MLAIMIINKNNLIIQYKYIYHYIWILNICYKTIWLNKNMNYYNRKKKSLDHNHGLNKLELRMHSNKGEDILYPNFCHAQWKVFVRNQTLFLRNFLSLYSIMLVFSETKFHSNHILDRISFFLLSFWHSSLSVRFSKYRILRSCRNVEQFN